MSGILPTPELSAHIAEVTQVTTPKKYSDVELVTLFRRCFKWAMRKLKREEDAQDFGSWALVAVLEGRPAKLDWLWVDWSRESIGRKGTGTQAVKIAERYKTPLDAPMGGTETTLQEILPAPEKPEVDLELEDLAYVGLPRRTQRIVDMIHDGYSGKEIAALHHKSESWVWLQLAHWRLAVAKIGLARAKEKAPESVDVDTRVEVQWLVIR